MTVLIVKPINGTIRAETLNFHRIDPYLIVKHGPHRFFTAVSIRKDKYQNWEDVFRFPKLNDQEKIYFECWDYNIDNVDRQSDFVGTGKLDLTSIVFDQTSKSFQWVKVIGKNDKEIGEILVELEEQQQERPIYIEPTISLMDKQIQYEQKPDTQPRVSATPKEQELSQKKDSIQQNHYIYNDYQKYNQVLGGSQVHNQVQHPVQQTQVIGQPPLLRKSSLMNQQPQPQTFMQPNQQAFMQQQRIMQGNQRQRAITFGGGVGINNRVGVQQQYMGRNIGPQGAFRNGYY